MKMQENESYISTPQIPLITNEAYATTLPLSPYQEYDDSIDTENYATIDMERNTWNIKIPTPHIPVTNERNDTTVPLTLHLLMKWRIPMATFESTTMLLVCAKQE